MLNFSNVANYLKSSWKHEVPLLGHVHVPKTAGSSFRQVLDNHFGDAHVHLYFDNGTEFIYENQALSDLVQCDRIKAFSSHFVRRFPPRLGKRRVQYVTFLRDPVQQLISYIKYTRRHYASIKEPQLLSHLPPGMPDLSIRECAWWILNSPAPRFRNFRENYNTNFFARYPLLDAYGLQYEDPRYRLLRTARALKVLKGFLLVGVSEHMDESWKVLRHRAGKIGIELPDVRIPVVNVSEPESLPWLHADDEVGQKLVASTAEDKKLYEWAVGGLQPIRRLT